jgi:hypothetical protein
MMIIPTQITVIIGVKNSTISIIICLMLADKVLAKSLNATGTSPPLLFRGFKPRGNEASPRPLRILKPALPQRQRLFPGPMMKNAFQAGLTILDHKAVSK